MKIYLAATYARAAEMKSLANLLRAYGHEITSECWHDYTDDEKRQEYVEWDAHRRWNGTGVEEVSFEQWCAINDATGIRQADMVVMATEQQAGGTKLPFQSTGGRHFELGLACGMGGKYLIVIGEPENVFHHMHIIHCLPTWDAFFDALPAYEHAHRATWNVRKAALRDAG